MINMLIYIANNEFKFQFAFGCLWLSKSKIMVQKQMK